MFDFLLLILIFFFLKVRLATMASALENQNFGKGMRPAIRLSKMGVRLPTLPSPHPAGAGVLCTGFNLFLISFFLFVCVGGG